LTDNANAGARREVHIPVDLNQPIVLGIHNPNGDVTVRAVDRTDVLVGHVAPGRPRDLGGEAELMIDARNNRIEVRPNPRVGVGWADVAGEIDLDAVVGQFTNAFRRGGPRSSARPGKVRIASGHHAWSDITVEVPRAMTGRVEIHTASGGVRIEGVTSQIALNTMSGDLQVVRTHGNLDLQTASGDLVIEGATGRLTAHTTSGDVRITSAQIDGFQIQTANGDILLDAMLGGEGPFRAQTASGDVRLTLRQPTAGGEEPAATLAFHTVSGDANVTPPFRKTDRRLWRAGPSDRGPRIDVTTVSGDLVAAFAAADSAFFPASTPTSRADDVPPAPPASPAPAIVPDRPSSPTEPAPPMVSWPRGEIDVRPEAAQSTGQGDAERLAVLEAVERGEIDVEEALRRLEAADAITSAWS
jgi:Putative adhesin